MFVLKEWEGKAVEHKERYTKAIKEFEANGGSTDRPVSKKRGKAPKKAAKKIKKKESDEEEESAEEESD